MDKEKYELWVMGDFNANAHERNSGPAKLLFDLCRTTGIKRLINDITRPNETDSGGTYIDNILTD